MAALEAIVFSAAPADERMLQLLLTSLCLVAALLAAAVVIALVNRWRRQRDAQEDFSPNEELARYRSLYEAGAISAEEFERLRAVLSPRMKESLGASPPPPAPPSPSGSGGPTVGPPTPETGTQKSDGPDEGIRPA